MADNYTDATDTDFTAENYSIAEGKKLSAAGMREALHTKENVANKQDTLSSSSTEYPSSKAVYDAIQTINAEASNINTALTGKQDRIDADTDNNIVAYSGAAGTVKSLTRATSVRDKDTASETYIPTEKAIAIALAGKANASDLASKADASEVASKAAASDLTALQATVSGLETTVGGLQKALPIGTILMFDGYGWEDNQTLVGWYACTANNSGMGCPNLVGSFIKGNDTASHSAGGNAGNQITISTNNLPAHTHDLSGVSTGGMSAHASGSFTVNRDGGGMSADGTTFTDSETNSSGGSWSGSSSSTNNWWRKYNMDISHSHSLSGSTGNNATTAAKLSIEPQSYALIFIRRCE
jgi:hypothetical protein